jgi:hypothetical protein
MGFLSVQFWVLWILTALAAYLGAYAAEKGKRRAAHEDQEQILRELANTTQKLKQIEATIAGELWEKQMRWNQKKDIYASLLVTVHEIQMHLRKFIYAGKSCAPESYKKTAADLAKVQIDLIRSTELARLFTSDEVVSIAQAMADLLLHPDGDPEIQTVTLARFQDDLIAAAKRDMGLATVLTV